LLSIFVKIQLHHLLLPSFRKPFDKTPNKTRAMAKIIPLVVDEME